MGHFVAPAKYPTTWAGYFDSWSCIYKPNSVPILQCRGIGDNHLSSSALACGVKRHSLETGDWKLVVWTHSSV